MGTGFTYGSPYGQPYYQGGGVAGSSPYLTEVSLAGHPYLLDYTGDPAGVEWVTVPLQKDQFDTSPSPGEQTINPEAFWRRVRESFHLGAGQTDCDREESSPYRFRYSVHIDPWTRWQACLLPVTVAKTVSAATNQKLMVAGSRLYYVNGTALHFYTDVVGGGGLTNVTGVPGTQASSIASDGFNVITAHGASGVYKTNRTIGTTASHITGTVSLLGFVRGRFLAANANSIYDITALTVGGGGALPASIFTHGNTDFSWVGFAEGSGWIYAAGYSGDKSLIYKTQVREDGTALTAFSVAAELPEGEIVSSIKGYLGRFICIGTNKGFRLAVVGGSGDLQVGVNIETTLPVLDFEGQGQFIWYGWGSYASSPSKTGLGRMSTSDFVNLDLLQPAYASDLMVHGQANNITSIVTFQNRRIFVIDQIGMYYEGTNLEAEGYLDTGRITYGTNEPKVGLFFNIQHQHDLGEIEVAASINEGSFISIGERPASEQPMTKFTVGEAAATNFEFRLYLRRDASVLTEGPCFLSWLFRSEPQSEVTTMFLAAIRLAPILEGLNGVDVYPDVYAEMEHLKNLRRNKTVSVWTQSERAYSVILQDFSGSFLGLINNEDGLGMTSNNRVILKMKEI